MLVAVQLRGHQTQDCCRYQQTIDMNVVPFSVRLLPVLHRLEDSSSLANVCQIEEEKKT